MNLDSSGSTNSRNRCSVAAISVSTGKADCVVTPIANEAEAISTVAWVSKDQIHLRYRASRPTRYADRTLRRRDSTWTSIAGAGNRNSTLDFSVQEAMDEPPVLIATDKRSGKSLRVFDPNPQLGEVAMGSVSVYRWKDRHGRENIGGLVKPPGYDPRKRYPLVIQTHGFDSAKFFRTGYSDTASAGRALAGRGMAVLQVREPSPTGEGSWQDAVTVGMDVYLAAIDQLAAEGVVDPARVGISGYSYTGWLVATSITQAPERFAAAELANTDPVTLTGYYEYVDTPLAKIVADARAGARPYGEGLQSWIERVPSFATDKITAPTLFQAGDPWHLIGFWDMYAAMRDQQKPVELQYIRSGEHNLRKPLHVLAHQEMIVDWFDFWLNSHEDSDPEKRLQYERWQGIRDRAARN